MIREERIKELTFQRDQIDEEINKIKQDIKVQKLKKIEEQYVGKYFEDTNRYFKVISAISSNEYRIDIVGVYKEPEIIHENEVWDNSCHRHPFEGRTDVYFAFEEDLMISDLKNCKEITKDEFNEKYKYVMSKFLNEFEKEWKLKR